MTTSFTITSAAELDSAIREIDIGGASAAASASYTITFASLSGSIALGTDPLAINLADNSSLTIVGAGQTLDGNGIARGLFVNSGSVTVQNLTIADTVARGGDGASGGGGGAGLGGGLFIGDHGAVTLAGVHFTGNQAIGGNGAVVGPDGPNGGGGGMGGNGAAGVGSIGGGGGGLGRGADGGAPGQAGQPGILPGTVAQAGLDGALSSTIGGGAGGADGGGGGGSGGTSISGGQGGAGGAYFTSRGSGYLMNNLGGGGGAGIGGVRYGGSGNLLAFGGGGFGGGGGAGIGNNYGGGGGGFGGGGGASTLHGAAGGFGGGGATSLQGGGGLGGGGAIFVSQFGELTITSGTIDAASVAGGLGAQNGQALGAGILAMYRNDRAITLDPASGATILIAGGIADDGPKLNFPAFVGTPLLVRGDGRVVLAAANTNYGGAIVDGGTLELADPGAIGPGFDPGHSTPNAGYVRFEGTGSLLVIDGTTIPMLTIDQFASGQTIDLAGLAPSGSAATLEAGGTLAIPTSGGTIRLRLYNPPVTPAGSTFAMISDGAGGTLVMGDATLPPAVVTVRGAAGSVISFAYDEYFRSHQAQVIRADPLNAAVLGGTAIPFVATPGGTLPAVSAGQTLEVIDHTGGAYTLGTQANVFVSDAAGAVTVTAGAGTGVVFTGTQDLTFIAGAALTDVFVAGGNASIDVPVGMGGIGVALGNGNNTITAIGGENAIATGSGSNLITLGIGRNDLRLNGGSDTVMAGPGVTNITATGTVHDLIFLGSTGGDYFGSNTGAATVVGGIGTNAVFDYSNGTLFFAGGTSTFEGAGTVVGGSAAVLATLRAEGSGTPPGSMVFTGSGPMRVDNMSGAATVVGNPAGSATVNVAGGSALIFATGPTFVAMVPGAVATVAGGAGPLAVSGGSGLFLAGPLGNSHIGVAGDATVFGTAAGDVLLSEHAINSAHVVLVGGAGAETLSGAGGFGINTFFGGSGPELIKAGSLLTSVVVGTGAETLVGGTDGGLALFGFVQGRAPSVVVQDFEAGKDFFTLINFGTGELTSLLAGATSSGGSESFSLTDGTHVTLLGFTGLSAANFL